MRLFFELSKMVVYSLLGAGFLCIYLVLHDSGSKSGTVEFINNVYWIHAPYGSTGFEFLTKEHPFYHVKIYWDSPDKIEFQGRMKYIGSRKESVCVFEASGFSGTKVYLVPGGYLEKVSLKENKK